MKQTINKSQFIDAFHAMGRGEQFSYDGLGMLFNYLEDMERDIGEEYELDVIGLCCDFSENTLLDIVNYYGIVNDFDVALDYLEYNTNVIWYDRAKKLFLFQQF